MTGLTILGLSDAFDFIECAEGDKSRAKPSPALYLSALARLALSAEDAIAIEDSPNGIHAAKAAGLFCVGHANAVTRQLDLSEADIVVDSLDDLPLADVLQAATAVAERFRHAATFHSRRSSERLSRDSNCQSVLGPRIA